MSHVRTLTFLTFAVVIIFSASYAISQTTPDQGHPAAEICDENFCVIDNGNVKVGDDILGDGKLWIFGKEASEPDNTDNMLVLKDLTTGNHIKIGTSPDNLDFLRLVTLGGSGFAITNYNDIPVLFVSKTGRLVGINTVTPQSTLDVNGQVTANDMCIGTDCNILSIDEANRRVGVKTTTPESALDVEGQVTANNIVASNQITANKVCIGGNCKTSWPGHSSCRIVTGSRLDTYATATCPTGTFAVGGGGQCEEPASGFAHNYIITSCPSMSGTSCSYNENPIEARNWFVECSDDTPQTRAYVICCPA